MVVFDEAKHTYTNPETNRIYISVSQLLKRYKEPFDTDFFAEKAAKKQGKKKEDIIAEWQKNNKAACDKGQHIHDIFENYIKTGRIHEDDYELVSNLDDIFDVKKYYKVHSEKIVYNDEHEIAGTSDLIADVDKDYFDVLDFKTNKKFNMYSKYGKYLKYPLNNLQECQYNDYSLQLSLYAFLYSSLTGKKVRQINILYHDGKKFHNYPTPYLFWEITMLLKHYGQAATCKDKTDITNL